MVRPTNGRTILDQHLPQKTGTGLDVVTPGVANATWFYLVATNFSRLVARPAPRLAPMIFVTFFGKTYTNDTPLNG